MHVSKFLAACSNSTYVSAAPTTHSILKSTNPPDQPSPPGPADLPLAFLDICSSARQRLLWRDIHTARTLTLSAVTAPTALRITRYGDELTASALVVASDLAVDQLVDPLCGIDEGLFGVVFDFVLDGGDVLLAETRAEILGLWGAFGLRSPHFLGHRHGVVVVVSVLLGLDYLIVIVILLVDDLLLGGGTLALGSRSGFTIRGCLSLL
jgi:hypothetical protein